jgi:uncharacterized protein (DUF2384 family)
MPVLSFKSVPQPTAPVFSSEMVAAGLRAFFNIADLWGVSNLQAMTLLGGVPKSTFQKWKSGDTKGIQASRDLGERISYVLGIFKALEIIYQRPDHADRWVSQPNLALGGQSALQRMLAGSINDLATVRDYLDSVRGGW